MPPHTLFHPCKLAAIADYTGDPVFAAHLRSVCDCEDCKPPCCGGCDSPIDTEEDAC